MTDEASQLALVTLALILLAMLSASALMLNGCGAAHPPVEFIGANGVLMGTVNLRVQGVPVRVELDAESSTAGEAAAGTAAIVTPLGGVACDLLPDDADCHPVEPAPFPPREETATHE